MAALIQVCSELLTTVHYDGITVAKPCEHAEFISPAELLISVC